MKKLLAVLGVIVAIQVGAVGTDGTSGVHTTGFPATEQVGAPVGDSGGPLFAGNHCADNNGDVCDNNQGNQTTLADTGLDEEGVQGTGIC